MRREPFLAAIVALSSAGCGDSSVCGAGDGEYIVEVEAVAMARPGSRLEVCINGLCNPEDPASTYVSVRGSGERQRSFVWGVQRLSGSSWESLAGGTLEAACTSQRTVIRIELDSEANPSITQTP